LTASRLRLGLDLTSDCAVVWFAVWTIAAYLGMLTDAPVTLLVALWLAGAILATALLVIWRRRSAPEPREGGTPADAAGALGRRRPWLIVVGVASGVIAGILAAATTHVSWWFAALAALVAVACAVAGGGLRSRATSPVVEPGGRTGDLVAVGVALGFAALSLLIKKGNPDDVFYVNRATAVAQLGRIPVLDVIFTHEQFARGGGAGLPVDSYSALQGAVAHMLGIEAPTVAYYLFPPLFTFLAIWSLWRLLRAWTPQRAVLCFAFGSVFWLFSAQAQLSSGSYFLTRIWQGKVAFVAWLVPTIYVFLTRWLEGRDVVIATLLLATGISSLGMTGSATFAAPLIFLTALISLAACKDWRGLSAPLVAGAIPLVIGVVVLSRFPLSKTVGSHAMPSNSWFYHQLFGYTFVCVLAGAAVWLAPWLARPGPPARLATGIAVITAVLLTPGVLALLHDVSGLTETLRRTLWLVPIPTVVGLLAAAPVPRRAWRLVPVAVTVVVACLLVVLGHPVWRARDGAALWHWPPSWKVSLARLTVTRAILARYDGSGPILVRKGIMQTIAIVTVEPKAVNARNLYLIRTREPQRLTEERLTLTSFAMHDDPLPPDSTVRTALDDLRVGLVCIKKADSELMGRLAAIAPSYRKSFAARGYVCFERPSATG
jgi:Family of unknown function (DUF6077)